MYSADGNQVYALREADLVLEEGSFTALAGRSGCGKTTLLNLSGAVDLPTSGEVRIEGLATGQLNDRELSRLRRRRIGFVFQFFNLLPTLTVVENVELPLLLDAGRSGKDGARGRAARLLERVGLAGKAGQYPHQISGGEMQRAAIARALSHQPAIVIADEPTGNLDSVNAEAVLELLRQTSHELGHAVLIATHSREAAAFASRVITMKDGRLSES